MEHRLDVLIRLHDPARGADLRRALFSLVCQNYRPLSVYLLTQRFSSGVMDSIRMAICATLMLDQTISFNALNYTEPEPQDARAALLNLGIRNSGGRYLAFLDYDDVIYPNAYCHLINELTTSQCALAVGNIALKRLDVFQDAVIVEKCEMPFRGKGLLDLFRMNFCPLHSFVLDRTIIHDADLWFDQSLSRHEDYDFLLRIGSKYLASFNARDRLVGDYYVKNDGSNTNLIAFRNPDEERLAAWKQTEPFLESRRQTIVLSPDVQRSLGIYPPDPNLTIRRALDWFEG